MKTLSRGLLGLASILIWPAGLAAHQLDSGSAGLWQAVLHLFRSPDHALALLGAMLIGGLLWRMRSARRRNPSTSVATGYRKARGASRT